MWAAWATFAVYVALGIFALVQVLQAKKLRESQARPFVVVDFEVERVPFLNLVVANLGQTMARSVRFEVDPPFESSQDASWPVPLAKLKLFREGIPSLAPGKRFVLLFDRLDRRPEELPSSYRVTLRYEGERGPLPPEEQWLDLDLYRNLVSVHPDTIHDVSRTLKKIEGHLGGWSAHGGGLLVLSPEEKRQRDEEFLAWVEEERKRQAAESGRPGLVGRLLGTVDRLRRRG